MHEIGCPSPQVSGDDYSSWPMPGAPGVAIPSRAGTLKNALLRKITETVDVLVHYAITLI
jgi:hypothetical protein